MKTRRPVYCCIPIEFIQPWDQNEAIRQVKELGLGNMVMIQGTFHVGNSDEDRRMWKERFPHLAERVDATPRFPERPQHGMCALFDLPAEFRLEQLRLCRELGLTMFGWALEGRELPPDERARLRSEGEEIIFSEMFMGENLSMLAATLSLEKLKEMDAAPVAGHVESSLRPPEVASGPSIFDDPEQLDFQVMHDWFVDRFRKHGERLRRNWRGPLASIEASMQMHLAMEAGTDVPIFELVPSDPLRGLAATRGAARAYRKDLWGVHTAMGYYRAPTDMWTPERLRIAYDLFYSGGASLFSECNMPLRNWGLCSGFFSIPASPPIRWAEEECREFDDPICVRAREVVGENFRFTQFHERPAVWPRVRLGYLAGHLDTGEEHMWLVDHPGFLAGDAAAMWRHFDHAFDSEPWYESPRQYYWQADPAKALRHGTPPCGQVDIVPIEAPDDVLRGYDCLAMLGWNTMTEQHYARLKTFVEAGGVLFLSVPHLATRTRTDQEQTLIHDGDVADLCGVRVLGSGETVDEVLLVEQTTYERYTFPQGSLYLEGAPLARLELAGARVLAHPRGRPDQPALLENRLGKGCVYLLATWEYPGERLDAFVTDILRTLAEGEQGDIAVEGSDIFYAVYDGEMPSGQPFSTVYLVNHDIYGQSAYPELVVREQRAPVRVGLEMRVAWVCDDLIVAPHDRFVKVTDVSREDGAWRISLASERPTRDGAPDEERLIQIEVAGKCIEAVALDGQALALRCAPEGDHNVSCCLSGANALRVRSGNPAR